MNALLEREARLMQSLKARRLRAVLPLNQMFDELGNLRGLCLCNTARQGVVAKMQVTVQNRQIGISRVINEENMRAVFFDLSMWRLNKLELESTLEMRRELYASYRLFEHKFRRYMSNLGVH
ncbi:hypothetical protein QTV44_002537 [Vibrio vulnificus]|nr:hypothetical protein [Vibrio vulnificus]